MSLFDEGVLEYSPNGQEDPYGVKDALLWFCGLVAVVLAFPFVLLIGFAVSVLERCRGVIFAPSHPLSREGGEGSYFGYGWA